MKNDIEHILNTEEDIASVCKNIGKQLTAEYKGKYPLVIGVLKGALPLMSDTVRQIDTPLDLDFINVFSYCSVTRLSREGEIVKDLDSQVEGLEFLIIEDIIDSGLILSYLVDLFKYRKASSVKIVTLLDKPENRSANIKADIIGFEVPNKF